MLGAIGSVLRRSVARAAKRPGPPRLFALNRMVEILLHNVHRFDLVWPRFMDNMADVLGNPAEPLRAAGLEALDRAVVGVIGVLRDPGFAGGAGSEGVARVEHSVLLELERLFRSAETEDLRAGSLRVLFNALQRHGEQLTEGWDPVLDLLEAVAKGSSGALIGPAFKSLQLLCSDFAGSIPPRHMARCIEVAAGYGLQSFDVNVSLTAMSVLWSLADTFGRVWAKQMSAGAASPGSGPLPPPIGAPEPTTATVAGKET